MLSRAKKFVCASLFSVLVGYYVCDCALCIVFTDSLESVIRIRIPQSCIKYSTSKYHYQYQYMRLKYQYKYQY